MKACLQYMIVLDNFGEVVGSCWLWPGFELAGKKPGKSLGSNAASAHCDYHGLNGFLRCDHFVVVVVVVVVVANHVVIVAEVAGS